MLISILRAVVSWDRRIRHQTAGLPARAHSKTDGFQSFARRPAVCGFRPGSSGWGDGSGSRAKVWQDECCQPCQVPRKKSRRATHRSAHREPRSSCIRQCRKTSGPDRRNWRRNHPPLQSSRGRRSGFDNRPPPWLLSCEKRQAKPLAPSMQRQAPRRPRIGPWTFCKLRQIVHKIPGQPSSILYSGGALVTVLPRPRWGIHARMHGCVLDLCQEGLQQATAVRITVHQVPQI